MVLLNGSTFIETLLRLGPVHPVLKAFALLVTSPKHHEKRKDLKLLGTPSAQMRSPFILILSTACLALSEGLSSMPIPKKHHKHRNGQKKDTNPGTPPTLQSTQNFSWGPSPLVYVPSFQDI
ncbi:hypothetical protein Pst134EA_024157 [Puccinia striiformis f. sp. tritici]|nr:hypothetical protein Pst134EA_024157 [Puccinia striiformis f. sp. tritici]KAH9453274.1 hypothetical protein Pst134EA_024157 [Puccinia striiformis f. sp. tritici]